MVFDCNAVARDFGNAAEHYDEHAVIQQQILEKLLGMTGSYLLPGHRVLDAGCGTGRLKTHLPNNDVFGVDIAHGMVKLAQENDEIASLGDVSRLPFADNVFDQVLCCMCLQWVGDVHAALEELKRVAKPGGHIAIATPGSGTLKELRSAFSVVDNKPRVSPFLCMGQLVLHVKEARLYIVDSATEGIKETYDSPKEVMLRLKDIGAGNKHRQRPRGLFTPRQMEQVSDAYRKSSENADRSVTASWEVYYFILKV